MINLTKAEKKQYDDLVKAHHDLIRARHNGTKSEFHAAIQHIEAVAHGEDEQEENV